MSDKNQKISFSIKEWTKEYHYQPTFECNCSIAQDLSKSFNENINKCAVTSMCQSIGIALPASLKSNQEEKPDAITKIDIQMLSGQSANTAAAFFMHAACRCGWKKKLK